MADNKKGVIMYCDLIHTVEKIINKDRERGTNNAGELFYHYLQYINDLNPEPINDVVDFTFEPIKQTLKRDLKSWESKKIARSEAGKKGGLAKASNAKQTVANLAVKDKVIVKVKDKVINKIVIPSLIEFLEYVKDKEGIKFPEINHSAKLKYEAWTTNDWKDGNDKKITNWKTKILNTIPHLPRKKMELGKSNGVQAFL